ncbi:DUF3343 domain-containing protein [Dysosmobacter sp.]|uniref:DUF3343 domain-containing protein n=1 Tax=Dysosmobacter sp. TaxID=2591382 RepID=UPI002A96047C|nr:DUF3343 domain-containing protein [Dysosmobacter sp.]MDY5611594.1 DUF3343 domain-containing protein [Dysosmobacter sp.]
MRSKEPRLVISFHTTAEAMATERLCRQNGLEGKLISVPRSITSDCGLAWSAPVALREAIEALLVRHAVEAAGYHELLL